jgi:hypothetical protein
MTDYSCTRVVWLPLYVCMAIWLSHCTGSSRARPGTGTPNDRRPEESLTTSALLAPAAPVLSARVDCLQWVEGWRSGILPGALATVTEPTLKFLNRAWLHWEVPAVYALSTASLHGNLHLPLTEHPVLRASPPPSQHAATSRAAIGASSTLLLPPPVPSANPQTLRPLLQRAQRL